MTVVPSPHRLVGPSGIASAGQGTRPGRGKKWLRIWLPLAFPAFLLAAGCNQAPPPKEKKSIEVTVTTPIIDEVIDYQDFTGRLDAVKSVELRARVSGYLDKAYIAGSLDKEDQEKNYIKEGAVVERGTLLFLIDPRPYKYKLDTAIAQAALAEANVKLADVTFQRAQDAANRGIGVVSLLELDQDRAQQELARANLKVAKANQETAQLNWDWTQVRAPITGRISRRFVDPGNMVMADSTMLTTIVTEDPLYAYFDVDERTFLEMLNTFNTGTSQDPSLTLLKFRVLMRLANQEQFTHIGQVNFLDNRINANTGTIRMRGEFANPTGNLKPGLFARVRLPLGKPYKASLISDEAIQSDQGKHYVYVVNEKDEVVYRPVELGQTIDGLRMIKTPEKGKEGKEGLQPTDRVIIVGMQRVRPETHVSVKNQDPPKPPKSPLLDLLNPDSGPVPARPGAKLNQPSAGK
jgi:RND family efflux transporter MFP subunit